MPINLVKAISGHVSLSLKNLIVEYNSHSDRIFPNRHISNATCSQQHSIILSKAAFFFTSHSGQQHHHLSRLQGQKSSLAPPHTSLPSGLQACQIHCALSLLTPQPLTQDLGSASLAFCLHAIIESCDTCLYMAIIPLHRCTYYTFTYFIYITERDIHTHIHILDICSKLYHITIIVLVIVHVQLTCYSRGCLKHSSSRMNK